TLTGALAALIPMRSPRGTSVVNRQHAIQAVIPKSECRQREPPQRSEAEDSVLRRERQQRGGQEKGESNEVTGAPHVTAQREERHSCKNGGHGIHCSVPVARHDVQ